jgi:hypothetical protein
VRRSALLSIILAATALFVSGPWHAPASTAIQRAKTVFAATDAPATCAAIDKSWIQIDVPLTSSNGAPAVGRVFSLSDGAIAVLVIVDSLTSDGAVASADFSASVKVSAAIITSASGNDLIRFDPPVRSRSGLAASDGAAINSIAFCYRIAIPAPPAPSKPNATPTQSPPPMSPTPVEFDLGAVQTANAEAATSVAHSQATAAAAQTALAESKAAATDLQATAAAQASQIAQYVATVSAPTPTATAAPQGTLLFSADSDETFAQLTLPAAGWRIDHGLIADGSGAQDWVALPAIPGLGADQAIEAEVKFGNGGSCPRNFGLALRGADTGFVAGGVEWACDQAVKLWSGQSVIAQGDVGALGSDWHLVRLEVNGENVRMFIDGALSLDAMTTQSAGGQLAIWSSGVPLTVRSLRVFNLS